MGAGPMTGSARGYCNPANAGNPRPFYGRFFFGRGFRRGFGMSGMGRGFFGYPPAVPYSQTATKEDELQWLAEQSDFLKFELDRIYSRINELKKESSE